MVNTINYCKMNGTLNKVMLIGRLGSDVKLTYFEKDSCVGQVSLATDESYTDKATQQKVENTQWHNIVLYNKLAERVEKYAKKGLDLCRGKIAYPTISGTGRLHPLCDRGGSAGYQLSFF